MSEEYPMLNKGVREDYSRAMNRAKMQAAIGRRDWLIFLDSRGVWQCERYRPWVATESGSVIVSPAGTARYL